MSFSAALFVVGVAVWAETVRHYRRRIVRNGFWYKRPINLTIVLGLGFASFFVLTWRACRWTVCHVWKWDIRPRVDYARHWIRARRAQTGQTPGAVLHAGAQTVLPRQAASPVAPPAVETAPTHATAPAAVLVAQAGGPPRWEMLQ